jgi:HSP20 family protein
VDISIENDVLTVSGERKDASEQDKENYHVRERRFTGFERRFRLPDRVDQENVGAALKDGVLTITLNQREEAKPKTIPVEDGNS